MTRSEIIDSIRSLIIKLREELPREEYAHGWTDAKRHDILKYFEKLEVDMTNKEEIPYISLVRTLDSVGIGDGDLLEEACNITNEINAKNY